MEEQRVYKDFDLPTKHLGGDRHFVPAKARDDTEIERRKSLRPGVLLAEHQERGLAVASTILKNVKDADGTRFASRIIAASGLNTAWYGFARGAEHEVMRRRLKLPFLAVHTPELRESSDDMLYDAAFQFSEARAQADTVRVAIESCYPKTDRLKRSLGRMVGKSSLTLACVELGNQLLVNPLSGVDTQLAVRQRSLLALSDARTMEAQIGLPPSIAQLADPDSHLSVFWRREAPNGAMQAYETAIELQLAA